MRSTTFRIDFDDEMKSKLPLTLADMKRVLYSAPEQRDDVQDRFRDFSWVMDFSPESIANIALRKTDMLNFAVDNEGNLYNNLFYKVRRSVKFSFNHYNFEVDKLLMDDCEENGEFCQFYEDFFSLLDEWKDSEWAQSQWENSLESYDWSYNCETGQWDYQKLPLEHIKFKTVESIISKILGDKEFFVPTSTPLHKKFFERLNSFDFDGHFSDMTTTTESTNTFTTCSTSSESIESTTTEHNQETLDQNMDRFLGVMSRITGFIRATLPLLSAEELRVCHELRNLHFRLSDLKDGSIYSLAKIKVAMLLNEENIDILDGITAHSVKDCLNFILRGDEALKMKFSSVLEEKVSELALFNAVKQYPDGLASKRDGVCVVGEGLHQNNDCKGRGSKEDEFYLIFLELFLENFYFPTLPSISASVTRRRSWPCTISGPRSASLRTWTSPEEETSGPGTTMNSLRVSPSWVPPHRGSPRTLQGS